MKDWDTFPEWVEFVSNDEFFDAVNLTNSFWIISIYVDECIGATNAHGASDKNWRQCKHTPLQNSNISIRIPNEECFMR